MIPSAAPKLVGHASAADSVMIGAFGTQLTTLEPELAVTPALFTVLLAVVARVRRGQTAELMARVRGGGQPQMSAEESA